MPFLAMLWYGIATTSSISKVGFAADEEGGRGNAAVMDGWMDGFIGCYVEEEGSGG